MPYIVKNTTGKSVSESPDETPCRFAFGDALEGIEIFGNKHGFDAGGVPPDDAVLEFHRNQLRLIEIAGQHYFRKRAGFNDIVSGITQQRVAFFSPGAADIAVVDIGAVGSGDT